MATELWPALEAAGVSAALSVAAAALAIAWLTHFGVRMFASSVARRTAWQTAIVATLGCAALEVSGIGQAALSTLEVIVDSPVPAIDHCDENTTEFISNNQTATPAAPLTAPDLFALAPKKQVLEPNYVPELPGSYDEAYRNDFAALDRASNSPSLDAAVAMKPLKSSLAVTDEPDELATPAHTAPNHTQADNETNSRWVPAVFATVWCLGSLWLLGRLVAGSYARAITRQFPHHLEGDQSIELDVRELAAPLGLRRTVRRVTLPEGCSPIAFGLWRPTIGLPADFGKRFTAPQRRAILAHELEHLAAGDPFWRMLADVLVAALWWHPAAWSMRRQLIVESERVADEASRALPGGPEELAAALVVLGKRMARRRDANAAFAAEGDFRSSLGQRVERLLAECDQPWRPFSRSWLAVARAACGVVTIVCVISLVYWTRHHLSSTQGEVQMKTFMNTWRQSLAGVTLAMMASGPALADTLAANADADVVAEAVANAVVAEATVAVLQEEGERREERERRPDERPDREGGREGERERRIEAREEQREERRDGDRQEAERPNAERAEARRREAQEIKGQVERLQNRLRELGDKNPDESRELGQQVERLMNRIRELRMAEADRPEREEPDRGGSDRERPDRERPNAERGEARRREAQEIEGQVERLQNRLRELGDKNPDESRELSQQVERLMNRIRELRMAEADRPGSEEPGRERQVRERPDGDRPDRERPNAERAQARRREAQEIKGQVERLRNRLRELGDRNPDESRAINQQVERLMNRIGELHRAEADRPERERPDRERPDREPGTERPDVPRREGDEPRERPVVDREIMRGRHLRSAIDHLRAGGMHDAAERLERENVDLLRRVDRRRPDFIGEREPRPDGGDRPGRRAEDRPRDNRPREERPRDGERRPDRPDGPPRDGDRPRPGRPGFEGRPDSDRPGREANPESAQREPVRLLGQVIEQREDQRIESEPANQVTLE